MKEPLPKPKAAQAMAANRAAEQREKQLADLMVLCRDGAVRIVELTELVADLQDRVTALEGQQ